MQNFPQNPAINMGGMAGFFFVPSPYLKSLPPVVNGIITEPLQFNWSAGFFSGYATRDTLDFSEQGSQDDQGTSYKQNVVGSIPGNYPPLTALIREMESYRHLVLIRDPNGSLRLVGYENPLIFLGGFKSGTKPADYKGYTFSFSGESIERAPYYQPA